jgi:VWFA-related protein
LTLPAAGPHVAVRSWFQKRYTAGVSVRLFTAAALAAALGLADAAGATGSLVRVTAVVTNARGEPVAGLRAADFQITVDGAPQPVDGLEFSGGVRPPRVFGLLLDEFHVDAAASAAVRDMLLPLVDSYFRAGDQVVVFKPLDALASIQPTSDIAAVRAAIVAFEGRKGDYTPRTVFEKRYMAQAPNAVSGSRAQIVSSALRELALRLGELKGVRPAIVLVTDGFARQRVDRYVPANLLSAVRVANRGDVPVYVFAPSEPPPAPDGTVDPASETLRSVAAQTGGDFNAGPAAFTAGLSRMVRDLDAHYVLSYQPAHGDDGRFHSVLVTLKRGDVRVRARAGYVAPLAADLRARAVAPTAPSRALRRSPLIQAWFGVTKETGGQPRVTVTWEPAPAAAGPPRPQPAMAVVTASTPAGAVLFDGSVAAVGNLPPSAGSNRAQFEAPAGRIFLDVKILDAKGVVLDFDARDIEVPNLQTSRATILPPAVLRAGSAREFRSVSEDPDAAPVPSREFRRTERLLLRVPAYEAGGSPARVSATLLNRWRQPIRALPAMDGSPREGITQFDIPLAALAPGEYSIRLSAGSVTELVTFRVRG